MVKQIQIDSPISTTIEFSEDGNYFSINDSSKMQSGAIYPYKEFHVFKDSIHWKTPVDPLMGQGSFFGSINRMTGEMKGSYLLMPKAGDMVTIDSKLMCDKKVGNKF